MNSQRITLISVLFMGYLTSGFLKLVFPFLDIPISAIWNGIMLEYLGYSVFLFYAIYTVPFIVETYFGMQAFTEGFINMVNSLPLQADIPNNPLTIPLIYAIAYLNNIAFAIIIHRELKKQHGYRSFIP